LLKDGFTLLLSVTSGGHVIGRLPGCNVCTWAGVSRCHCCWV